MIKYLYKILIFFYKIRISNKKINFKKIFNIFKLILEFNFIYLKKLNYILLINLFLVT